MKISKKLTWGAILLGVVPVLIATGITGWVANHDAKTALEEQAHSRLMAVRDATKGEIEDYFDLIEKQVMTQSANSMIINAMRGFNRAYNGYVGEVSSATPTESVQRSELASYYNVDFAGEYQGRNAGANLNMAATVAGLDSESVYLQHRFIKANPNPLGGKDALSDPDDGSTYGMLHSVYHPIFRDFLNTFEYYDIFLADAKTGDIVYSVFKELDYTTSLIDGPYANSGIGQAFKAANAMTDPNGVAITDFAPYTPSYEDQAGFVASPIFDEGEKIGVLIFQMPIARINTMMTHHNDWENAGLGLSGETYLVGADGKTRSMSRFLIEDKDSYMAALKTHGVSQSVLDMIETKGSNIGLQPVDSEGFRAAAAGQTGFDIFPDYRGVPVLSAYAPIAINGIDWVIMSEIDKAEAFAAVTALTKNITKTALGVIAAIVVVATLLGKWLSASITRPLTASVEVMKDIADGEGDLTQRLDDKGDDELAEFAGAYNRFADKLSGVIHRAQMASRQVATGVAEVRDGSVDLSQRTEEQASSLEETAASMEQMNANVRNSAENTAQADELSRHTRARAEHGGQVVASAVTAMGEVNEASKKIADIIGMVGEIAFQTNLLALNASVEAARAGEQGRGFAVVATEVRNLAQRSASAATEIKALIGDTVEKVGVGARLIDESGEALQEIMEGINQVSDLVGSIHTASQEQATGIDQVNIAIGQMDETTQQNAALVEESSATADAMAEEAQTLEALMGTFKVDNG